MQKPPKAIAIALPNGLPRVAVQMPGAWFWLAWIAAGLRLANLAQESLWYDEAFTAMLARQDWSNMLIAIRGDVHPPLWYALEWVVVRVLGSSEFALRFPSAVLSVAAVLLVWRIALDLGFERRTAFVAGLIAATMPGVLYYGQEARMYMLLSVFVLLMVWRAINGKWLGFAVAGIGAVYTQNLGLFYVAALGAVPIIWSLYWWNGVKYDAYESYSIDLGFRSFSFGMSVSLFHVLKFSLAIFVVFLAWLPWLPTFLFQAAAVKAGFWMQPLTVGGIIWPFTAMTMGIRLAAGFQMHVYAVAIGITLVGLVACRRWLLVRSGTIVLAGIFGAAALAAIVSLTWRAIYLPRAFVPAALLLSLIWAYALMHLEVPNRRLARILVIPAFGVAFISHYFPAASARYPIKEWAAAVATGFQPGDVVYHVGIDTDIMYRYYLPGQPTLLLSEATDLSQSLTPETKRAVGLQELPFDQLAAAGYRRAWLVTSTTPMSSQVELDEIDRIKRLYPWHIIKHDGNEFAQETIYLVELNLL